MERSYDTFHNVSNISNTTNSNSNLRLLHSGISMRFVDEVIAHFGYDARLCYESFPSRVKSGYCAYVNNHKAQGIKIALLSPKQWIDRQKENEELPTFDEIAKELGFTSPSHAYTYYKQGMRHILKHIKKNPHKYPAIIEAGGLAI